MFPLPNDEPPAGPILIEAGDWRPPNQQPTPRLGPMVLWYLWLTATSLIAVLLGPFSRGFAFYIPFWSIFIGNIVLTPAWTALAIRPLTSHVVSVLLVYAFVLFVPMMRRDAEVFIIPVIVMGSWGIMRWCRVMSLDLLQSDNGSDSRTPRLAEQVQFSLRALILMSAAVALGISLYLFFHESPGWSFYKIMFFIVVPSELLVFWGVLGRARWYIRLPWLLVATHHWILLPVISRGFQSWEQLYDWNDLPEWLSIPIGQIVGLSLLRWAGYRIGIPKPRERALPVAVAAEPQSPWD
jgi:hypothetical protein